MEWNLVDITEKIEEKSSSGEENTFTGMEMDEGEVVYAVFKENNQKYLVAIIKVSEEQEPNPRRGCH